MDKICKYLRHPLKTTITGYFKSSATKYTLIFVYTHSMKGLSTTSEANDHGLVYLHYWGHSQSVTKKMNGAPRLFFLTASQQHVK